jgi:hypothetical protein
VIDDAGNASITFQATSEQFENLTRVYLAFFAGETLGDTRVLYLVP